jgi:hypothetical protein
MAIQLPRIIANYLAAERLADSEAVARCFSANAEVRDEGRTVRGLAAIKQWNLDARTKYQYTVTPLDVSQKDENVLMHARLEGNFPGSPANVNYTFTLADDLITALEIS